MDELLKDLVNEQNRWTDPGSDDFPYDPQESIDAIWTRLHKAGLDPGDTPVLPLADHREWIKAYTHGDTALVRRQWRAWRDAVATAIATVRRGGEPVQSQTHGDSSGGDFQKDKDGGNKDSNRYAGLAKLSPAHRKAYLAFLYAELKRGERLEDRVAWELLRDDGIQDVNQSDLQDYELPEFDTWSRYLRSARNSIRERKHNPRSGRKRSG